MAEPIDFGSSQRSGYPELAGASPIAMNVYTSDLGVVHRRPGIATYAQAPATAVDAGGIAGLYATDDGKVLAVGSSAQRHLYEVGGGGARLLTQALSGTRRPKFAQTEMIVAIAGGSDIVKYERSGGATGLLGGSPPKASHVLASNLRLLANDVTVDRTKVRFSDISQGTLSYSGLENWTATNPVTAGAFTAESKPDPILAIGENTNEIFVWGPNSLQMFGPDPTFGFAPTATREFGLNAADSIVKADDQFFWFDQYRRFVMSDGRSISAVSDAIQSTLNEIAVVDDCFGYRIYTHNVDIVAWTFPTDGRTFAFQKGSGWAQWAGWDGNWTRFKVNAHCYRQQDDTNVVGTTDGFVAELDTHIATDLGDAIRAHVVTGYYNRGTEMRKKCHCVRLVLRRGTATGAVGPQAWLAWKDRPGAWEGRVPIDLGQSNDTEIVVELRSLGVYRRRQWMFEFDGPEELLLVAASEDFEVLEQ